MRAWVPVPTAVGVYVTVQFATPRTTVTRVQVVELKVPALFDDHVTVPTGVIFVPEVKSSTVAVQVIGLARMAVYGTQLMGV